MPLECVVDQRVLERIDCKAAVKKNRFCSISYSGATHSEIHKICTISETYAGTLEISREIWSFLITQLKVMFLEISETLKIKYTNICENTSILWYQYTRQCLDTNIRLQLVKHSVFLLLSSPVLRNVWEQMKMEPV